MKKLISLIFLSTWVFGAVSAFAPNACENMPCCTYNMQNISSVKALHCEILVCNMASPSQKSQTKLKEALFSHKHNVSSDVVFTTRKEFVLSHTLLHVSFQSQKIRDGCSTYLELQHFLI
ncbi:MAG: hypothetical protein HYW47_00100 [Deltaproteobacteria bacterium]|nr:hypothetical protein [Deltaproteobacteria bacterium]